MIVEGEKVRVSLEELKNFKDTDSIKRISGDEDIRQYLDYMQEFIEDSKDIESQVGIVTYIEDYDTNPYVEIEYSDGFKIGVFENQLIKV